MFPVNRYTASFIPPRNKYNEVLKESFQLLLNEIGNKIETGDDGLCKEYLEGIERLLKAGANVNLRLQNGNTMLHIAAFNAAIDETYEELAKILINNNADFLIENADNISVLAILYHKSDLFNTSFDPFSSLLRRLTNKHGMILFPDRTTI